MIILLLLCFTNAQQQFNRFKSYKDSKLKPKMYSKEKKEHGIEEYLTELQLKMLKARKGKDSTDNMFDNKWSGFNGFKTTRKLITENGRLPSVSTTDVHATDVHLPNSLPIVVCMLAMAAVICSLFVYFINKSDKTAIVTEKNHVNEEML